MMAIDMNNIYLGIESYYTFDDEGELVNVKMIGIYYLTRIFSSDKVMRKFYVNLTKGDNIETDEYGNVIKHDSTFKDIHSLTDMHSLKETVDSFLNGTKEAIYQLEYGRDTYEFYAVLQKHIEDMNSAGNPAYIDTEYLEYLVATTPNLYLLAFGNPFTHESREKCLYKFLNKRGKEQDGI
jgi:hypothetical protein